MTNPDNVPKHLAVPDENEHWLPNDVYDFLKVLAQIVFPALGTLYFALSGIWGFPKPEQVIGTITAIDAFLGVFLSISKMQYLNSSSAYDGTINVIDDPSNNKKTYTLELNDDPDTFDQQKQLVFKINPL